MTPDGGKKRFWKLLVRAVMKIYNKCFFFFSFLCFGKLLSSQDDKKAIGKSRFVNSNASQVKIFYK